MKGAVSIVALPDTAGMPSQAFKESSGPVMRDARPNAAANAGEEGGRRNGLRRVLESAGLR